MHFTYYKTYHEQNKHSMPGLGISALELKLGETRIQTAIVSYITYLRYQSHQFVGWGYGETKDIRGEAMCSYILVFSKLGCKNGEKVNRHLFKHRFGFLPQNLY